MTCHPHLFQLSLKQTHLPNPESQVHLEETCYFPPLRSPVRLHMIKPPINSAKDGSVVFMVVKPIGIFPALPSKGSQPAPCWTSPRKSGSWWSLRCRRSRWTPGEKKVCSMHETVVISSQSKPGRFACSSASHRQISRVPSTKLP